MACMVCATEDNIQQQVLEACSICAAGHPAATACIEASPAITRLRRMATEAAEHGGHIESTTSRVTVPYYSFREILENPNEK
jgi:hypothetical protein